MLYGLAVPIWIFVVSLCGYWIVEKADRHGGAVGFAVGYTTIVTFVLGGFFVALWLVFKAGGG